MMPTYKLALLIAVLLGGLLASHVAEPFTTGLGNEDVNVAAKFDPVQAASEDRQSLQVGPLDWPQWGGSRLRNNTPHDQNIPTSWDIGEFDRRSRAWNKDRARNVRWRAALGSETYGNPSVANGKVFIGTNNGASYLKRYPSDIDLGVMLCFEEATGKFLWQYSSEKLPTGRVHDWPDQGMPCTPVIDGNRMWFVTNRCEVVCADTEGFYDGKDDGLMQNEWIRVLQVDALLHNRLAKYTLPDRLRAAFVQAEVSLPERVLVVRDQENGCWTLHENRQRSAPSFRVLPHGPALFQVRIVGDRLSVSKASSNSEPGQAAADELFSVHDPLLPNLGRGEVVFSLREELLKHAIELLADTQPVTVEPGKVWSFLARINGVEQQFEARLKGPVLVIYKRLHVTDKHEADVIWRLDMMSQLGVSPHNMSHCSIAVVGERLFVCTSNGVDEGHIRIPAPQAPSFVALHRDTGEVLWTDNSPGENIMHSQWASPSYAVLGGQPQVLFPGGDGWLYSFDPEGDGQGGSKLLWKFDCNPKDSFYAINRATRNGLIAFACIYDGLVYIAVGEDPEHGEGQGRLWCIDPTRRGDVSAELAVHAEDHSQVIPVRRLQAVVPEQGEVAIDNPNSAVVWHYDKFDQNGDGIIDFEEEMHRSISTPVIKDDLLYIADFSGLFQCLNAKTGEVYWTYDQFAACWSSALVVNGKVYIADEDGHISIFHHSADPAVAMPGGAPLAEINMGSGIYSTPVAANGVLYIATRNHLFAIAED